MSKIEKYLVEKAPKFGGGYKTDREKEIDNKNNRKRTKKTIEIVDNVIIGSVQILVKSKVLDKIHMTNLKKLLADMKKLY